MIDIKRTFYTWSDTQQVATGSTISEEGQGLVAVLEGGVEKVKPSAAAADEVFVGFAMFRQASFSNAALVEDHIVPTAAPYVVELSKQQLLIGQIRVLDTTTGLDLTSVVGPVPAAGEYVVDLAHGTLAMDAAEAGKTVRVFYRYELSVADSILKHYEATPNHPNPNYFSQVGVGKGKGRVFTMYFDQSIDWSSAVVPSLGVDGMITSGGLGALIPNARVVKVPSPTDAFLGIEFLV